MSHDGGLGKRFHVTSGSGFAWIRIISLCSTCIGLNIYMGSCCKLGIRAGVRQSAATESDSSRGQAMTRHLLYRQLRILGPFLHPSPYPCHHQACPCPFLRLPCPCLSKITVSLGKQEGKQPAHRLPCRPYRLPCHHLLHVQQIPNQLCSVGVEEHGQTHLLAIVSVCPATRAFSATLQMNI